jgi:hypothetical protein
MSRLTLAAAVAAFAVCAAPAVAQQAAAPAPSSAAPAKSAEEVAFEARGQAFQAEAARMGGELSVVMDDASLDAATKKTRTDAILNQYEPRFSAFADDMAAFLRLMAEKPEHAADKTQILAAAEAAPAQVRNVPSQIRASIAQALAAPAAPAAPAGQN